MDPANYTTALSAIATLLSMSAIYILKSRTKVITLLKETAAIVKELGELVENIATAMADEEIDKTEIKEITGRLSRLNARLRNMMLILK